MKKWCDFLRLLGLSFRASVAMIEAPKHHQNFDDFPVGFWSPFRLHEAGQAGAKMALFWSLFFGLILEAFLTRFRRPFSRQKPSLEEAWMTIGEPSFSSTGSTKTSLQASPAHPGNASQNCFQKSSENGTKITTPGAPKIFLKWHRK